MNTAPAGVTSERRLHALGAMRLRLRAGRRRNAELPVEVPAVPAPVSGPGENLHVATPEPVAGIRRLALLADPAERRDPAINKMYMALTEAVAKAGLQSVRVCDVAEDPTAALMVFGFVALPDGVHADQVLRVDALAVLHADRERKRALWERLQVLGRGEVG